MRHPAPTRHRTRRHALLAGVALLAGAPVAARAQSGGDGFLFRAPAASLTLRAGFAGASAGSDLFRFVTDSLTLGRGDFGGVGLGAEVAIGRHDSRLDALIGIGFASATAPSEFHNLVDQDDRPIVQSTTFRRVPMTVGVRAWLLPRGRAIGNLAWVPARVSPYVAAGGGAMWYRFRQRGDFVDYETFDVFTDDFETSGVGPMGFGAVGVDLSLSPRVAVTLDARWTLARAATGGDFDGFDDMDLSGLATTAGFTFRF